MQLISRNQTAKTNEAKGHSTMIIGGPNVAFNPGGTSAGFSSSYLRDWRIDYIHFRTPPTSKHCLGWVSVRSTVALIFLVSLVLPIPLHAQFEASRISDSQSCGSRTELSAGTGPLLKMTFGSQDVAKSNVFFADGTDEPLHWLSSATFKVSCDVLSNSLGGSPSSTTSSGSVAGEPMPSEHGDNPGEGSKSPVVSVRPSPPAHSNEFFYKNKLEFSLEGGWLPINIPFVFDVFLGDGYTMTNLKYTLVPLIASIRWETGNPDGPWIFRGNWDLEASGAAVVIPRGPETHYFAFILGFRRNFVPRSGRIAPYFDGRLGMGAINAKEPLGVLYAQGQNFTFTMNMGSGIRYNFSPRYAFWGGLNWMHISNLYLSQPQFANYGINVYGPMFGIDVRLGRLHRHSSG